MNLRRLEYHDIEAVLAIQSACPEIAQWLARDYASAARGEMAGWVAEEAEIRGFIVARHVGVEIEVLNLAVTPGARRRGLGAALLRKALDWGGTIHAQQAILEVRESNLDALRFYERHNFQVRGRRERYYTSPIEDALVLAAPLPQP